MIVGNGDIASVLGPFDRDSWLFFASGVSNSQETREEEYAREWKLLMEQDRSYHLVYFSSLSIFDGVNTRYRSHKQRMEVVVREAFPNYTIVRIGNITWGDNPHTLINHFKGQFARGEEPVFLPVDRFIVDEEEFLYWISRLPNFNCEVNIPGKRMKPKEVWHKYVGHRADVMA